MSLREMIADERSELLEFLQTLSAEQWEVPSLCEGWRVRDVVAHLCWDNISIRRYLLVGARYRSPDRVNQHYVDAAKDVTTAELLDDLASTVDGGWISRVTPAGVLADLVVHHQDIRRPLDAPRTVDAARLRHTLDKPNRFAHPRRFMAGLRFTATDLDWSTGDGPEVSGCGEALALAIVGRGSVLGELAGEGVAVLADRMGAG
ncbi:maleylpyruvate isomerase family mycothiol-dependent enzyme [Mycobacterium sp. CPCC 205372]|uniref:Maleylpyruvate isomerase family mycothiol-dependent enzyme n=1 Tax=Mycobacterium hippophais TaxID=3016340 RepID=A0ABT4PSB4_9MYCO|nr:maleylpyruvate isomerase family mycothiol-dependent enzyme [Mycobacterium hippophais]MCZ8379371.1 maleylpyruvate isomerase family mycothiol-dependent enzyme [Mycobacterium hippophais]